MLSNAVAVGALNAGWHTRVSVNIVSAWVHFALFHKHNKKSLAVEHEHGNKFDQHSSFRRKVLYFVGSMVDDHVYKASGWQHGKRERTLSNAINTELRRGYISVSNIWAHFTSVQLKLIYSSLMWILWLRKTIENQKPILEKKYCISWTASPASVALKEKNDLGGLVEYIYTAAWITRIKFKDQNISKTAKLFTNPASRCNRFIA